MGLVSRVVPVGLGGVYYVAVLLLRGFAGFVFRDHGFVKLFARAQADHLNLRFGSDGFCEVLQGAAGNFRDEDFAAYHVFQ